MASVRAARARNERQALAREDYSSDSDSDDESCGGLEGLNSTKVRHGFIQKVYCILGAQLLVTTVIAAFFMQHTRHWMHTQPDKVFAILSMCSVTSIAIMLVFMCCPDTMRQHPTNYILLSVFTVAEACMVGFICVQYKTHSVMLALGITTFIVLSLTAFAFQTKYDFTGFAPYLFVAMMCFMGFGFMMTIGSFFFPYSPAFQGLRLVYSALGALLFSFYLVFDTQMIIGGKHTQFQFSIDDYCMAAIALYLDIIQLFIHILQLIGERDN
eukprot:TRINITY_DN918_c0_g1_i4.p1 TRINITY_DN918_c0_g1~~TRINITY_DN918_c0_g1_i4.p1  ORF type:complete len:270 (-),score=37.82 TRINITY_DN918_c0_g1_i4:333-1142(-)